MRAGKEIWQISLSHAVCHILLLTVDMDYHDLLSPACIRLLSFPTTETATYVWLAFINKTFFFFFFLSFEQTLLRKLERASSTPGFGWEWFCHQTIMYDQIGTTWRINKECLPIHSPKLQQHTGPIIYPDCISSKIKDCVSLLSHLKHRGNVFILVPINIKHN